MTEALALDVDVICSDIPVFRTVGADGVTYLDLLDELACIRAGKRHSMQETLPRLVWQSRHWEDSVVEAMRFVETFTASLA